MLLTNRFGQAGSGGNGRPYVADASPRPDGCASVTAVFCLAS